MRTNRFVIVPVALCAALLAQESVDREAYARDHVRFLVQQLEQWSKDFPQAFNAALVKPPVDSSKLSDTAKAGADEFARSVKRLAEARGREGPPGERSFQSRTAKDAGHDEGSEPGVRGAALSGAPPIRLGPGPVHAQRPRAGVPARDSRGGRSAGRGPRRTRSGDRNGGARRADSPGTLSISSAPSGARACG